MIELLVVIVVGSVLAISVVAMFVTQTRTMALNEDLVDLEQNLRVAMDIVSRDVRQAGLYTRFTSHPFSFGPVFNDLTGDGVDDSSGNATGLNGSDTILMNYSEKDGITIPLQQPGAGVNIYMCHDSGLEALIDGLGPTEKVAIALSSPSAPGDFPHVNVEVNKVNIDSACPGAPGSVCDVGVKCDNITFPSSQDVDNDGNPLSGDYEDGKIWTDLTSNYFFISQDYDCDGTDDGDMAMVKVTDYDLSTCAVLAFGINDFQVKYVLENGAIVDEPVDPLQVRTVRLSLIGETRNEHNIGGTGKRTRALTTEVLVRNLNF